MIFSSRTSDSLESKRKKYKQKYMKKEIILWKNLYIQLITVSIGEKMKSRFGIYISINRYNYIIYLNVSVSLFETSTENKAIKTFLFFLDFCS